MTEQRLSTDTAIISPGTAKGSIFAPPSKSVLHRLLIGAALADGTSKLFGFSESDDILATMDVLTSLGTRFERIGCMDDTGTDTLLIHGCGGKFRQHNPLVCRESGSTLRFTIPLCMRSPFQSVLIGSSRLFSRPLSVYEKLFLDRFGELTVDSNNFAAGGQLIVKAGEPLSGGEYELRGDVSSQFITGMIFALSLCENDSTIYLTSGLESKPYIELTMATLSQFGVSVFWENETALRIPGGQCYHPYEGRVEGDASNAAFFGALNYFGGKVQIHGLNEKSVQGDQIYDQLFSPIAMPRQNLADRPTIDLANCPDLAPILFTMAAERGGAIFTHTDRLRLKECDRIAAMQQELKKFGAQIRVRDGYCGGTVYVDPTSLHAPIEPLDGHNDHRVVMSLAILATKYGGTICGVGAVRKSFPTFFDLLQSLGICIQM